MMRLSIPTIRAAVPSLRPAVAASLVLLFIVPATSAAPPSDQAQFGSPEEALHALKQAAAAGDRETLKRLFGPQIQEIASGDSVQDAADLKVFAKRLEKGASLAREGEDKAVLHIGAESFPFPVPIMRSGQVWYFDTEQGLEEILNRRIGENELNAIRVCRGYVASQYEYFELDRDADGVLEYAQRLASTSGKRDGLYWETSSTEQISPLGPLVADARAEGYTTPNDSGATQPQPYHGYIYRLLTVQGPQAPGGAFDYVINGNMVAGFALIAYPAEWGSSGVMTFAVNSNGTVHENNLGEDTNKVANSVNAYNPDKSWKPASD